MNTEITIADIMEYGGYDSSQTVLRKLRKLGILVGDSISPYYTLDDLTDILDNRIVTMEAYLWESVGSIVSTFAKRHNINLDWENRLWEGRPFYISAGQRLIDIETKVDLIKEFYTRLEDEQET